MLDYSGPAFLGLVNKVLAGVGAQIATVNPSKIFSNAGFALQFAGFYFASPDTFKEGLIEQSQKLVWQIVDQMTADYSGPISREAFHNSLNHFIEVVIELYADELNLYDSQYFGTTLHYLWTILATHEQETVLSWIMSLDKNHMNRNCRTLTIPRNCSAKLLEFREQYAQYEGSMEDADAKAPVVAEWKNGVFTSKDERISYAPSSSPDYIVIRYPASLDIRVDVVSDEVLDLRSIGLDVYQTVSETDRVSKG